MADGSKNLLATLDSNVTHQQTTLNVNFVTGDVISVSYDTLPGNQPNTYGNKLFIWQNDNQVPWGTDPLNQQNIATNTQAGSAVFTGLEVTKNSYIVGYGVGPDVSDVCATAFVPAESDESEGSEYPTSSLVLSLKFVGTNSVAVGYQGLTGYQPQTEGNWLGMWQNNAASYNTPPQWKTEPSGDSPGGTAAFNNVTIVRDSAYTVAYFMGTKQTTMAATLTFTT